jgi:predicted DNA-binding transcriptional regulator YafY
MATSLTHPYSHPEAFERLMVLIATLIKHPGVGADEEGESIGEHDAMTLVLTAMQDLAAERGVPLPDYSVHTLRKDLRTLRRYGILDQRMYRWGYYLGTGALRHQELQLVLQALAAQAQYQGDPKARQVLAAIERRSRGLDLASREQLFYPVRTHLNRVIVYTDPEEMMRKGQYRRTLFHQLEKLELAIAQGQQIEIYRRSDPHGSMGVGALQVYPLQMIYSDVAWYLLYEYVQTGHLEIERIDRLSDDLRILEAQGREMVIQMQSLREAHQLLTAGWGLYLGQPEVQLQERRGRLALTKVVVRFLPPVAAFIGEGECRHARQQIHKEAAYVDFQVELPGRSLDEFFRWVCRFMGYAQILEPEHLVERHRLAALKLVELYKSVDGV